MENKFFWYKTFCRVLFSLRNVTVVPKEQRARLYEMEWPLDLSDIVYSHVRNHLRPHLKKRLWKRVHVELRDKWCNMVFQPLCQHITNDYRDFFAEGPFELGYDISMLQTVCTLVNVLNVPRASETEGIFFYPIGYSENEEWRREVLSEGVELSNPGGMRECMLRRGLQGL